MDVPAAVAPEAKRSLFDRLVSDKRIFAVVAALWTAAAGILANVVPGWLAGPPLRTIRLTRLSVDEVFQPSASSKYRFEWAVRTHYTASGLKGTQLKFVPWIYDAQTNARLPRVDTKTGQIAYSPDDQLVESGAQTQSGIVRLSVPLPSAPGSYYVAVAVFAGASRGEEYDFLRSKPLTLSRDDLARLATIFGTH